MITIGYIDFDSLSYFSPFLLPETVKAIEQKLPVLSLGITDEDTACGAIAGYISDYTFHITSLYISPDYRRKGYGRALLTKLEEILLSHSEILGLMTAFTTTEPEHQLMLPFLDTMDFKPKNEEETLYTFLLKDIQEGPLNRGKLPSGKNDSILPFCEISDSLILLAEKDAKAANVPLPAHSLLSPAIHKEMSFALMDKGQISAFIAFDNSCGNMLTLACAWTEKAGPVSLFSLVRTALHRAEELYSPETPMAVQAVTQASAALIKSLIPAAHRFSYTYYKLMER